MESKAIHVVDDKPGMFGAEHYVYNMPQPPITDAGYWINDIYDIHDFNAHRYIHNLYDVNDRFHVCDDCSDDTVYFSGKDYLFTSTTPTGYLTDENDGHLNSRGSSFQIRFRGSGTRTLFFGNYSNTHNLYSETDKARWTKACGVSMSIKSVVNGEHGTNFKIKRLYLVYKKFNDVKQYYLPIIENHKYRGKHIFTGPDLTKDFFTFAPEEQNLSAFIGPEAEARLKVEKGTCTGMIMNFYASGDGAVDLYNFKVHHSNHATVKNHSVVVVPAPSRLADREKAFIDIPFL